MPAIKITLARLIELFGKSVNTAELPEAIRALSARLMTLTAHVIRVDQKVDARVREHSEQISALTDLVEALTNKAAPAGSAPVAASSAAPAATPDAPSGEQAEGTEEEDEESAFVASVLAESSAEVAAINGSVPESDLAPAVAAVTALPRSKRVGGVK